MQQLNTNEDRAIREYLKSVRLGERFITLEKIEMDLDYEEDLQWAEVTDIVQYALNHGWELYDHPEEGWGIQC